MARAASMLGENDRRVRTRCRCGVHALFCPRMQSGTWVCRSVNACGRVRCTGERAAAAQRRLANAETVQHCWTGFKDMLLQSR